MASAQRVANVWRSALGGGNVGRNAQGANNLRRTVEVKGGNA